MKSSLFTILFILIAAQLCRFDLPWWGIIPVAALAGWMFPQHPAKSLLAGFAGGFLLWAFQAWWIDRANEGILSDRIGALFMGLPGWALLFLTGFLGGLPAGFGCLTGRWARDLVGQPAKTI